MLQLLDRGLAVLACCLLVALFCTVLLGVGTRAAGEPLIWTDEGARFLMIWLASTGWIIAGRKRAHVRIRFFQNLLPERGRRGVEAAIRVALAGFGLVIAWQAVRLVDRNMELEATSLPLSMAWFYLPLVPAGVALLLQSLAEVAEAVRGPAAREQGPIGEGLVE